MRQLLRRIRHLINRDRYESDLADELRFHQEIKDNGVSMMTIPDSLHRCP